MKIEVTEVIFSGQFLLHGKKWSRYRKHDPAKGMTSHEWRGWTATLTANAIEFRKEPDARGRSEVLLYPRSMAVVVGYEQVEVKAKDEQKEAA